MYVKLLFKTLLVLSMSLHTVQAFAKLNVFACEPEWASLANALGGDKLEIFIATTAKQDPHNIKISPKLVAKAKMADLLICTGAELEAGWLPELLRKSGNDKIMPGKDGHFMAAEYVRLEDTPVELDRSKGNIHVYGNPHIHLDPGRMLMVANVLSKQLSKLDPKNKSSYDENMGAFSQEWSEAGSKWLVASESLKDDVVVIHHNSWVYLQRWLELKTAAVLEPKPGVPASDKYLASVFSAVKETPADMILLADYQDNRASLWLADKTAIPIVKLPFSPDLDESLIDWFSRIIDALNDAEAEEGFVELVPAKVINKKP